MLSTRDCLPGFLFLSLDFFLLLFSCSVFILIEYKCRLYLLKEIGINKMTHIGPSPWGTTAIPDASSLRLVHGYSAYFSIHVDAGMEETSWVGSHVIQLNV